MSHINIGLNHIKSLGYTKHFTDEDAKLDSFIIINSEEVVELKFTNRQNKKLERTISYEFLEELMEDILLKNHPKIKEVLMVSPNVDQVHSKKSTNIIIENKTPQPKKMENEESKILINTEKINNILFDTIRDLKATDNTSLPRAVAKAKAVSQASQVILNSAKIEMEYLKRFGNKK